MVLDVKCDYSNNTLIIKFDYESTREETEVA